MNNPKEKEAIFGVENPSKEDVNSLTDAQELERWPEAVRQIYDLFKFELNKAGVDEALAITLVSSLCHSFGGMQFYLGRGKALERLLRDIKIWNDFDGKNVPHLIEKYNVSYSQVYRVISRMRARAAEKKANNAH
ncbi:Mor transcription activator family protein [Vibrio sp. TRT 17S01]|uniref:Mor transcription activator family protein n=1 Tax=Vibrio sp. TRT 17S01 TaxID=3418505 RepID=UPI003CFB606D